jgi:hypothetical protein
LLETYSEKIPGNRKTHPHKTRMGHPARRAKLARKKKDGPLRSG